MDSFKSTELEEALSNQSEQKESDRQLEHNTFREMLASGFQRDEEDITINFGRRTVLGYLENGDYRDEITSAKIDVVMNTLAEDAHPEFLTDRTPFIEIKASDEVLLRAEQNGGVTVNKFDLSRLFNPSQTAAAQVEADSKLELTQSQRRKTEDGRGKTGQLQGNSDPLLTVDRQVEESGRSLKPTHDKVEELLPSSSFLLPSSLQGGSLDELDEVYQGTEQVISGEFWEFDSAVLKFGLYEPDTSELTLEFQTGKDYTYRDVSPDIWKDFKEASSAGQFYNQEIKSQYSVEKVGDNLLKNRQDELDLDKVEAEIEATKSNLEARQQRLDDLASEALEKYHELDNTGVDTPLEADKSITVEIPFLEKGTEPQISHPLQEFDTSSLKDFLNQEYQLTDQLTKIYRVDAGDQIDYEALKEVVEKAVENLYPEWDEAEPNLADEIKWYRTNERSRELQVSTDLVLEEIDTEAQKSAEILNYLDQEDISTDVIKPLPPIQFQVTDTGGADSHFLDAVQQYIKDETDPRVLTENTGLSPAQVLVDEVILTDPNISGHSQTQQWVYDTAQDINLDVSQIRQDFTEQLEQQALVDEVAPQLVDILNELGTDNYQGKHRTIEFNNEQNELSLIENETGTVVMKAAWHPDEEKWENIGSSLTNDDRDHIQEVAQKLHHQQKDKETGLER